MNPLSVIIRRETAQRGVLSFARFMELALYCPVHGYYETKKDNPGRHGDFYTNVGVGELFGQLLAFQFAEWLEDQVQSPKSKVQIVEAGAHDGRLAKDILAWLLSNRPELFDRLEYWIIEPSACRQEWQKETLKNFASRVRWFSGFRELVGRDPVEPPLPSTPINREQALNPQLNGVIFGNELLDAMPVHRFGWDAAKRAWFEWGVTVDGEKFVWERIQNPVSRIQNLDLPSSLLAVLPDGYTVETSPAAENWWREAAGILKCGKLMTIDYGFTADELFSPNRTRGTLRAYFRHHASDDILANVGEQDLTAHVNFSATQAAGESVGLKTEMFSTQSQFLTRILEKASQDKSLGEWTPAQARQFQTLTHPEHLGRAFRVLVQSR
jgi:SAM-dependent MidA family methyltransferase